MEVVEQALPFIVGIRTAEALGVVFERLPADQKRVPARGLDAALELVGEVARRRRYDGRVESLIRRDVPEVREIVAV